jgi:hypothetical protein
MLNKADGRAMLDVADAAGRQKQAGGIPGNSWLAQLLAGPTLAVAANPKEAVQGTLEAGGATAGAGVGSMVAGLPGAAALGAGGARMGRALGEVVTGEGLEGLDDAEMTGAGIAGAAGPLLGKVVQHAARIYAYLPTVKGAVEQATREAGRRAAGSQASTLDQQLGQEAEKIAQVRKFAEQARKSQRGLQGAGEFGKGRDLTTGELVDMPTGEMARSAGAAAVKAETRLAELEGMLRDPARAVERARSKVVSGKYTPGTPGAALGALVGAGFGAFESAMTGGAIGFLLGRVRGHIAEGLVQNPAFVRWATGLGGQTIPAATAAFIADVAPQNLPGADELLGDLLDLTAGVVAGGYVAQQTGSLGLGAATGAGVKIATEQARGLADDMARFGERAWQELIGSSPAEE